MILACHNISKAFGEQVIVKSGSFSYRRSRKNGTDRTKWCRKVYYFKNDHERTRYRQWRYYPDKRKDKSVICHSIRSFQAETQFWKS